jgi:hypothetical protein
MPLNSAVALKGSDASLGQSGFDTASFLKCCNAYQRLMLRRLEEGTAHGACLPCHPPQISRWVLYCNVHRYQRQEGRYLPGCTC